MKRLSSPLFLVVGLALGLTLADCQTKKPQAKKATCTSTSQCTGGEVCAPEDADANADKICGPCHLDDQCALKEICDPISERCKLRHCFGTQCNVNNDCSLGQYCVQGLCLSPANNSTAMDACNVITCMQNADCPSGDRCDTQNDVCVLNLGCENDSECPTGDKCDVAANICVPLCTAENAAQVCGVKQICYMGACVQCLKDSDCPPGEMCNLTANLCEGINGCLTNRDCAPPSICNQCTLTCTDPPGPCRSDLDCCNATPTCDITTGTCQAATCEHDRFYPNGSIGNATVLPAGETDGLTLCSGQVEYFAVSLQNGDDLDVVFDGDSLAHIELTIMDGTGAVLADSTSLVVNAIVSVDGTYYVRAQSTDAWVPYGLTVSITRGTPCPPGPGAPNDTYLQAKPETQNDLYGLSLCPGDQDWFVVQVAPGQTLAVTLTTMVTDGELDLYLYDTNPSTLLDSNTAAVGMKTVQSNSFTGPRAYVHVDGADSATQNVYNLSFRLSGP